MKPVRIGMLMLCLYARFSSHLRTERRVVERVACAGEWLEDEHALLKEEDETLQWSEVTLL
jgi:hypothetical protein